MVKLKGRESYPIYFGATPELLRLASDLRKNMTKAEVVLWEELRKRKLEGLKFRRQHPIGVFVVDFFCYEAMLVIEVDGNVHDTHYQSERDTERTRILKDFGIIELRFRNEDILNNLGEVISEIKIYLTQDG